MPLAYDSMSEHFIKTDEIILDEDLGIFNDFYLINIMVVIQPTYIECRNNTAAATEKIIPTVMKINAIPRLSYFLLFTS